MKLVTEKNAATGGTTDRRYRHNMSMLDWIGSVLEGEFGEGDRRYFAFDPDGTTRNILQDLGGEFLQDSWIRDRFGKLVTSGTQIGGNAGKLQFLSPFMLDLGLANMQLNLLGGNGWLPRWGVPLRLGFTGLGIPGRQSLSSQAIGHRASVLSSIFPGKLLFDLNFEVEGEVSGCAPIRADLVTAGASSAPQATLDKLKAGMRARIGKLWIQGPLTKLTEALLGPINNQATAPKLGKMVVANYNIHPLEIQTQLLPGSDWRRCIYQLWHRGFVHQKDGTTERIGTPPGSEDMDENQGFRESHPLKRADGSPGARTFAGYELDSEPQSGWPFPETSPHNLWDMGNWRVGFFDSPGIPLVAPIARADEFLWIVWPSKNLLLKGAMPVCRRYNIVFENQGIRGVQPLSLM